MVEQEGKYVFGIPNVSFVNFNFLPLLMYFKLLQENLSITINCLRGKKAGREGEVSSSTNMDSFRAPPKHKMFLWFTLQG